MVRVVLRGGGMTRANLTYHRPMLRSSMLAATRALGISALANGASVAAGVLLARVGLG